ncbi:MAG: hypothetical protein ACR2N5_07465 [Solirubrobacterales bacterium]
MGTAAEAADWLQETSRDDDRTNQLVEDSLLVLNRVLHAHRAAAQDPYVPDASAERAAAIRLGFGTGDQLVDGSWAQVLELPIADVHAIRARAADIRPQERIAAVLAGREQVDSCEGLILRARADLDGGRARQGAIQLAAALHALAVEVRGDDDADQRKDLATLAEHREAVDEEAEAAPADGVSPETVVELREALRIGERILRRRRLRR